MENAIYENVKAKLDEAGINCLVITPDNEDQDWIIQFLPESDWHKWSSKVYINPRDPLDIADITDRYKRWLTLVGA